MLKRGFDIVVSFVLLMIGSVIFLGMAGMVKLDSKGPVFYRGVRAGRYGRPFRMLKFRTMRPDAERLGGVQQPTTIRE